MQATQIIAKFIKTKSGTAQNKKQFNGKNMPKDFLQKTRLPGGVGLSRASW